MADLLDRTDAALPDGTAPSTARPVAAAHLSAGKSGRPKLLGLSTAVPDHAFAQEFVVAQARAVFSDRREDFDRIESIFINTGIDTRYSVAPLSWFLEPQDWPSRTRTYVDGACALYRRAVAAALAEAELDPVQIDTVITVSTTGISTPSLDARVLPGMGFRPDVHRVPLFGLGCAGGAAGLSLAARLAAAEPETRVLMVAVELCTLSFRLDESSTKSIISAALFGDGAAACVISCRGEGMLEISGSCEHTWPDSLELMGWSVDPVGFGVVLSAGVPGFVQSEVRPVAEAFLAESGLAIEDLTHVVFHPGGAKVVAALEAAFEFEVGSLVRERAVLQAFGNMSSPTVLFVLRQALDDGVSGRGLMAAMGPGFSANMLTYEV